MTEYETTEYRGYTINIYYDPDPQSPRKWDNLGTMYTAHRRYRPEKEFDEHFEFEEVIGEQFTFLPSFLKNYIALPIYLYDHSGQTVSTTPFGCRWDSGWFGIIAVSIQKVKQEYGWKKITPKRRKQIEEYLQGEIDTYDQYLTGEVYGYQLISPEGEEVESCWDFFGDTGLQQILEECQAYADQEIQRQWIKKLKTGIQQFLPFPDFDLSIT